MKNILKKVVKSGAKDRSCMAMVPYNCLIRVELIIIDSVELVLVLFLSNSSKISYLPTLLTIKFQISPIRQPMPRILPTVELFHWLTGVVTMSIIWCNQRMILSRVSNHGYNLVFRHLVSGDLEIHQESLAWIRMRRFMLIQRLFLKDKS